MIAQFMEAMRAEGLSPPPEIVPDGCLHRFATSAKPGDDAGWYSFHDDATPAGIFGCWRTGARATWSAKAYREMSSSEKRNYRAKMVALERQRQDEKERRREEASAKAAIIWQAATLATADHPYLVKKSVQAHGLKLHKGALVVPMRDEGGTLHSLQFIDQNGGKKFLTGGRVQGCYHAFGGNPATTGTLCIVEGAASGATVHEATAYPAAVAFNAGNLKAVALAMRAKFPEARLIICADDDHRNPDNPGLTKATEAARAIGGLLAVPDFGPDRPEEATDFNDLAAHLGLETVKAQIEAASTPDAATTTSPRAEVPPQGQGEAPESEAATIARLAALSPLEYDRVRKAEAKTLGVQVGTLDDAVKGARKQEKADPSGMEDIEPWPDPVDPAFLLSEIVATVRRFIICDRTTAEAVALWVAMSWLMDVVQIAPLAVITAPEKRCGKTQLLALIGKLSRRPLTASNITPAALFRSIDLWSPTLLVDEADAFMKDNEELRGILNCGHTRDSAYIVRTVGEDFTPTRFNVWGAKAVAGIGHLADTLMDRAIVLELRRKLPNEDTDRLRYADPDLFPTLAAKLARFAEDEAGRIRLARPELPKSLNDRAQDNWEPLLAIADVAGGPWPDIARKAALHISGAESVQQSAGTELLADIQELLDLKRADRISTAGLIQALCADEEKPWASYNRGRPIQPRQVAKKLKGYGILSKTIRIGYETAKGYTADQFKEAFSRYLSSTPSQSVTTSQPNNDEEKPVTDDPSRYGTDGEKVTQKPAPILRCDVVTDKKPGWELVI